MSQQIEFLMALTNVYVEFLDLNVILVLLDKTSHVSKGKLNVVNSNMCKLFVRLFWKKFHKFQKLIDTSYSNFFRIPFPSRVGISTAESSEDEPVTSERPHRRYTRIDARSANARIRDGRNPFLRLCALALAHRCSCGATTDRCSSSSCSSPVHDLFPDDT